MQSENLGWHARVVSPCRRIRISVPTLPGDATYVAFLGPVDPLDLCTGKWAESGRTPREAIEVVLARAKQDLGIISKVVADLEVPPPRGRKKTRSFSLAPIVNVLFGLEVPPPRKHKGGWIKSCGYCGNFGTAPGKCPKCSRKKRT